MITSQSGYMTRAFSDPESLADDARKALAGVDFDTIVGRGMSGALVIPSLARALDKHWLMVRKPSENSHTWRETEGTLGERWIFVDDFVESGATRDACKQAVATLIADERASTTFVGTYTYEYSEFEPAANEETAAGVPEAESPCNCSLCTGLRRLEETPIF